MDGDCLNGGSPGSTTVPAVYPSAVHQHIPDPQLQGDLVIRRTGREWGHGRAPEHGLRTEVEPWRSGPADQLDAAPLAVAVDHDRDPHLAVLAHGSSLLGIVAVPVPPLV